MSDHVVGQVDADSVEMPGRRSGRTRRVVAVAFAIAAILLGVGYLGVALTHVDHRVGSSIATQFGDPSIGPVVNRAVEDDSRTVGLVGAAVSACALALSVVAIRREARRHPPPRPRLPVAATAVAVIPASLAIFLVVSIITTTYWNATSTF